jgi:hypothetical protein
VISSPCANVKISIVCVCVFCELLYIVCVFCEFLCCVLGMLYTVVVCMLRETCGQLLRSEPRNNV